MNNYLSTQELYTIFINCGQKITTDTRKLEKGSVFFALKGDSFDANLFAGNAIDGGCAYAIVDNKEACVNDKILLVEDVLQSLQQLAKYHRKQLKLTVIGITGSNGKTTNKELMYAVLSKKYNTYATKGNLNNHIGVPLTLLALTSSHQMAIIEMGANHQGEIALLSELSDPDYGIITNIGKAHLEGFGGVEGIKKGKGELYQYLKQKNSKIFINGDDETLMQLSGSLPKIYYGLNNKFDVYGELFQNSEFVEFKWAAKHSSLNDSELVKTHMFGQYNFINLLCAACIGNYFNVSVEDINNALEEYLPEMNRSQVMKTKFNTLILDAYNANPSSMSLAIDNFKNQNFNNKAVILGDMLELGEYSYAEHEKVLHHLKSGFEPAAFMVGEQFYQFKDQFKNYHFFRDVNALNDYFKTNAIAGSTLLIKGSRGMKLEKTVEFL